ncbi:hypothetical protein Zmor_024754 [Zophobas morio]|uniref:Uncharacterized protein n=1 Tax=Zophobas morio TaxID=2755281 RepID=A0AA38I142_9CUCU|nr:hypothetical protein Zmor_024754 [Zophobas morio]
MIEKIIKSQLLNMKLELKQAIDDNFKVISDRLLVAENDIRLIKSERAELKKSTVKVDNKGDLNDIISELEERNLRNSNVLVFSIPESKASELVNKIHDDIPKVTSILVPLGSFPESKKVSRIGLAKPSAVRPLKIVFENKDIVKDILRSNKNNSNRNYHFRPDLTKRQRDFNNEVRKEFKDRVAKGETDIMSRYKNNQKYCLERR